MKIESVLKMYEKEVMQLANVTGIGIGKKNGNDVIKVFVTQKLPESALQSQDIIPKSLAGFETVVEEIGNVVAQV